MIDKILDLLTCPITGSDLVKEGDVLRSCGGEFPIPDGIPMLIPSQKLIPTHSGWTELMKENSRHSELLPVIDDEYINRYLEGMLVPTCGNLYHKVDRGFIPSPLFPEQLKPEGFMVEIGCNWGRWVFPAARKAIQVIAVDIHLESLRVAKRLAENLKLDPMPIFVLADARCLPFKDNSISSVFSYSVIQHFSKENAKRILHEAGRILKPGGDALVQMPNAKALRSHHVLKRRDFDEGNEFDVRYYTIDELKKLFESTVGPTTISVDCFFGLNVRPEDWKIVDLKSKGIIAMSRLAKAMLGCFAPLKTFADSVFCHSVKKAS